ncbi:glycerate kinase [Propionibacteriaceae bacterium Y2011]|uniref:glycerate kinase n=1 Tax=Microlunatus sp. Y2014 TaxID=3418488 RepID=UPI003B4450C4
MRVLVATDGIGGLNSRAAGDCLGSGWLGQDVAVVPVGESGQGWLQSVADQVGEEVSLVSLDTPIDADPVVAMMVAGGDTLAVAVVPTNEPAPRGIDWTASSAPLGEAVARALAEAGTPRTIAVDLTGLANHDAGAGFLAALGARADTTLTGGVAELGRLSRIDLTPVRQLLGDTELIGVVPADQRDDHLLGLRGITSRRGREAGLDTAPLLAADSALEQFVTAAAPEVATEPGAGACGGLGWAIRALGGTLHTGLGHAAARCDLPGLAGQADLIVTGCDRFDFATRGGGIVAGMAQFAEQAMRPCLVLAGEVLIGLREMRTMGIEAAYPAWPDLPVTDPAAALTELSARVAQSWTF